MARTIEVCANNEWVANNLLSDLGLEHPDRDTASDSWFSEVCRRIDRLDMDVKTEASSGQRSTCNGWNGANTFSRFGCGLGTFDEFSEAEWDYLSDIAMDVAIEIESDYGVEG